MPGDSHLNQSPFNMSHSFHTRRGRTNRIRKCCYAAVHAIFGFRRIGLCLVPNWGKILCCYVVDETSKRTRTILQTLRSKPHFAISHCFLVSRRACYPEIRQKFGPSLIERAHAHKYTWHTIENTRVRTFMCTCTCMRAGHVGPFAHPAERCCGQTGEILQRGNAVPLCPHW